MNVISIKPLAEVPEQIPLIELWFKGEWPDYYGAAAVGDARRDLQSFSNLGAIPIGLVAFAQGVPCGFAAIRSEPFPTHPHLSPWIGAGYVVPAHRRQGIGHTLLLALEAQARSLGYARLYCASATSDSLMRRAGWRLLDVATHESNEVGIYEKAL
jgi:GNAT superfamily N-acetyltransferase